MKNCKRILRFLDGNAAWVRVLKCGAEPHAEPVANRALLIEGKVRDRVCLKNAEPHV
jgi:hypothetical protein